MKVTIEISNDMVLSILSKFFVKQDNIDKGKYHLRATPKIVSKDEAKTVFKLDDNWKRIEYLQNDFKDNQDGTITDHATGLMWQQSGSSDYISYKDAQPYIDCLNCDKFAGYFNWRLPTVDELNSLITEKPENDLYIDQIFDSTQIWCWSSDVVKSGGAWYVNFIYGYVNWYNDDYNYVRAVRSKH